MMANLSVEVESDQGCIAWSTGQLLFKSFVATQQNLVDCNLRPYLCVVTTVKVRETAELLNDQPG